MRLADQSGKWVPVRCEPFNMGFVYGYMGGQSVECIADLFAHVHGRSEREWNLILDEWREQQRQHNQKRITINGPLLAQFLQKLQGDEALLLQRQRDLEEQEQREAVLLKKPKAPQPPLSAPPRTESDLTKLSRYAENR